ncbi:MAG: SRPBCC domain-containing protein [Acidobacteria bacterium]|nr:SRPBCC domain-containing protein [Acidobacteriota bacterium]
METNQLSVHINADAQQVWTMLREPSLLAQWHGWDADSLDSEIKQIYHTDAHESADHRTLMLAGGDLFTLEPVHDGTQITLERGVATGEWAHHDQDITAGWGIFLQQLRFAVEHHPRDRRRTIYADGQSTSGKPPWELLGIDVGWLPEPGQEYALTLTNGVSLTGRVWYRTATALGLTVASYAEHGHGLLILVAQQPHEGIREHVGAQIIASTYGLGVAAYDQAAAPWDEFMERNYPEG